jgi:hypothetical protein
MFFKDLFKRHKVVRSFIVEPGVEFEGGAVHDNIIEDAVTRTEMYLATAGPVYCLQMIKDLKAVQGYRQPLATAMIRKIYDDPQVVSLMLDVLSGPIRDQ